MTRTHLAQVAFETSQSVVDDMEIRNGNCSLYTISWGARADEDHMGNDRSMKKAQLFIKVLLRVFLGAGMSHGAFFTSHHGF